MEQLEAWKTELQKEEKPSLYRLEKAYMAAGGWDFREFPDIQHMKVARLSALETGYLYA